MLALIDDDRRKAAETRADVDDERDGAIGHVYAEQTEKAGEASPTRRLSELVHKHREHVIFLRLVVKEDRCRSVESSYVS
jgi:hypothetical protein